MESEKLKEVLRLHKMWIEGKSGGVRADLKWADLKWADLSGAHLSGAHLRGADLTDADLRGADLSGAHLRGTDLKWADLTDADLRGADLSGADLDFSDWPLWCGGLHVITDKRIMAQLAYHFCAQDCTDPEYIRARNAIIEFANSFHRVGECGKLEHLPEPPKED